MKISRCTLKAAVIVIFALMLFASWFLIDRYSYAKAYPVDRLRTSPYDTLLQIGIIGDSWVAGNRLDSLVRAGLKERRFNAIITSSGYPGANTKSIYQHIYKPSVQYPPNESIPDHGTDYCIIVAGVNDLATQIGAKFYSYHMSLIINNLLGNLITPVIVTLPEFGLEETLKNMKLHTRLLSRTSAFFNNRVNAENKETYRYSLIQALNAEHLTDSVIVIDFDKICLDYYQCPDLFANPSHLSNKGNMELSKIIVEGIVTHIIYDMNCER